MNIKKIVWCAIAVCIITSFLFSGHAFAGNAFYRILLKKPNATVADAARCVYILNGGDPANEWQDVKDAVIEEDVVKEKWLEDPEQNLTKAKLAYMICKTLDIKGGLTMRIFGVIPRYALHECVYLELIARGVEYQYVSGAELMAVMNRSAKYQKEHSE